MPRLCLRVLCQQELEYDREAEAPSWAAEMAPIAPNTEGATQYANASAKSAKLFTVCELIICFCLLLRPKIAQTQLWWSVWGVREAVLAPDLIRSWAFHFIQGGVTSHTLLDRF